MIFIVVGGSALAQTPVPNDSARGLARRALALMDEGRAEAAVEQWTKVIAADPAYTPYQYEKAVGLVMLKRYDEALGILKVIYRDPMLYDRGYQLMGNCYDLQDDSSKSLPYYREGLVAYPKSGRLHYEMGAAAMIDGQTPQAVDWWLKGTQVEPTLATNYYWIAKTYSTTRNKIWACMYGEIFLNLETNTERTKEMSRMIYDCWNASLRLGDSIDPVNFCTDELLGEPHPRGANVASFPVAFEIAVAQASQPLIPAKGIHSPLSIAELVQLRVLMAKAWKKSGYDTLYANDVMRWNARMVESAWISEYLWWLYSWGNPQDMNQYYRKNENRYDTFLAWFGVHKDQFDKPHCGGIGCQ